MPEIISNTSCLIIPDNIDRLDILQKLYQTIHITEEVALEFGRPLANWMMVNAIQDKNTLRILNASVDLGEASTIALAVQMSGDTVMILDDLKARKLAKQLELKYTELLGILLKAKQQNIITSVSDILARFRQVGFRFSEKLEIEVLKLAGEQ
ncbi:MAG: DUF3368 domain-containing protein [Methylobacter sp.]|nr:MAG: DUF3368 domain-containing protein [Methylobacter sp.]